jgi:hypothetical protein
LSSFSNLKALENHRAQQPQIKYQTHCNNSRAPEQSMKLRSIFLLVVIVFACGYLFLLNYYNPFHGTREQLQNPILILEEVRTSPPAEQTSEFQNKNETSPPVETPHPPPPATPIKIMPPQMKPAPPPLDPIPLPTKTAPPSIIIAHGLKRIPNNWFQNLVNDLRDQQLLRENVLSKAILWENFTTPEAMYDPQKHALVYLGWVAFWNMESHALSGGPAGEFVIWGDFITALAALGYQLTIVNKMIDFWIYLKAKPTLYDIVITDYDGLGTAENIGHFPLYHCRYYLIDGFGTQEKFNIKRHLDLKRILTPYPFDGSNSPINLIASVLPKHLWSSPTFQGVIWAKDPAYLQSHLSTIEFLAQTLNITLVTTFRTNISGKKSSTTLSELRNLTNILFQGFLNRMQYLQLLSGSAFLLGLGQPLDGPTPLEAMAHGCSFINPLFVTPYTHQNKPTRYTYHSQHPFIQEHVPEPFAFTIDVTNHTKLAETIQKIFHRFQKRKEYERRISHSSSNQSSRDIPLSPFYYRHPFHMPSQYVKNVFEILSNTSESNCLSKYSQVAGGEGRGGGLSPPVRHPGNKVFNTFTDFRVNNCQGKCHPHWIQFDEGSEKLLFQLLNETERNKVVRQPPSL